MRSAFTMSAQVQSNGLIGGIRHSIAGDPLRQNTVIRLHSHVRSIVRDQHRLDAGGVDVHDRPEEAGRPAARVIREERYPALIDAAAALLLQPPDDLVVVVVDHEAQPLARQRAVRPKAERVDAHAWMPRYFLSFANGQSSPRY